MKGWSGMFPRAELVQAAERLLAARIKGDPEGVARGAFTPEQAAARLRIATAILDTARAVTDRRDPGDPEMDWAISNGTRGALWREIRADLAAAFTAARDAALQPGAHPALEGYALRLGALADWFEPFSEGRDLPFLVFAARVEQAPRTTTPATAPANCNTLPRRRGPALGLFG